MQVTQILTLTSLIIPKNWIHPPQYKYAAFNSMIYRINNIALNKFKRKIKENYMWYC